MKRESSPTLDSPAALIDQLCSQYTTLAREQAEFASLMVQFADARLIEDKRTIADRSALGLDARYKAGEFAAREISMAVTSSKRSAERTAAMARRLQAEAPDAWDAWRAGDIDHEKVVRINRALRLLVADRSKELLNTVVVDVAICRTPEILGRWLNQFIARVEPNETDERLNRSLDDRYVSVRPDVNGVSFLFAAMSAVDATAVDQVLTALAAAAEPGDLRTLQQRRADALVDVLLGRVSNGCHVYWDTNDDGDDDLDDGENHGSVGYRNEPVGCGDHEDSNGDRNRVRDNSDSGPDRDTCDTHESPGSDPTDCIVRDSPLRDGDPDESSPRIGDSGHDERRVGDEMIEDRERNRPGDGDEVGGGDALRHGDDDNDREAGDDREADEFRDDVEIRSNSEVFEPDCDTIAEPWDARDWDLPASAFRPDHRNSPSESGNLRSATDGSQTDATRGMSAGITPTGRARISPCPTGGHPRPLPVTVGVVVSIQSLFGYTNTPGQLIDRSALVAADAVRDLAAQPDTLFYRLLTDARGNLLDVAEMGRYPSRKLGNAIRFRDGVCDNPACTVPAARCDMDHLVPVPEGPTTGVNLGPKCRSDHRAKTHAGHVSDRTGPHTTRWTTPTGHSYVTTDEPLPVEEFPDQR